MNGNNECLDGLYVEILTENFNPLKDLSRPVCFLPHFNTGSWSPLFLCAQN